MDNKITADRIKQHIHYDWLIYVVVLLVSVFVFSLAYTWSGNLRSYEELDVMITCYELYDAKFADDALKYLNENAEDNIVKSINVQRVSPQANSWAEVLNNYGFGDRTSFIILPESKVDDWAKTFMCMYNTFAEGSVYNANVWERIIPDELKEFYKVPSNAQDYFDEIRAINAEIESGIIDEESGKTRIKDVYAELNALNENLYFAEDYSGVQGVFALRVDNLENIASHILFKDEQYEDEKYYMVMHYRNGNIGEYGLKEKTYSHYESFWLIRFMLTRYGVSA